MSTLNLSDPAPLSLYQPQQPAKPKSAALAFVLSLVVPGSGQIYSGRETAGAVTLAFFAAGAVATLSLRGHPGNGLGDTGLGVAISLYIFAFLDAYFSTLEYNAGISSFMIGGNPRIACILNFLTNGFGYFYLGERAKGVAMFVGLGVILRTGLFHFFPGSSVLTVVWLVVQSALAFDAYRLARRQLLTSFPEMEGHSWKAHGQLGPILPVALAIVLCIPLVGLSLLGLVGKAAAGIYGGATSVVPEGVRYVNPAYGLRITLPPQWSTTVKNGQLSATGPDGGCRILLLREFLLYSPERYQKNIDDQLSHKEGWSVYGHRQATLDGRRAAAMSVSLGPSVTEQMVTARTGLTVYSLITVARDDSDGCPAQLASVQKGLHFTR